MLAKLANGNLRVGIHVQGFATGDTVSLGDNPVPEPGSLPLVGSGLLGLRAWRRRDV